MALQIMMVALGCALGGVARFLLGKGVNAQPWVSDGFPWATLIINVAGSICLGIVAEFYLEREASSFRMETYLLLGTGFCVAGLLLSLASASKCLISSRRGQFFLPWPMPSAACCLAC